MNVDRQIGKMRVPASLAWMGLKRHAFAPGDLAVWDPSCRHSGTPHRTDRWEARLIILQLPTLTELIQDPDAPRRPQSFDTPLLRNPALAQRFVALHRALEEPAPALTQSDLLHDWIWQLACGRDPGISTRRARQDPALQRACELLKDDPARECTLGELAQVARSSRHRLSRLFRSAYGCAPHQFLVAQRLRLARGALDAGASIAEAAQRSGFTDQSHLHRHFKRALGLTPREYQRGLRSNVQDRRQRTP